MDLLSASASRRMREQDVEVPTTRCLNTIDTDRFGTTCNYTHTHTHTVHWHIGIMVENLLLILNP